jgi:hypothetical protein
MAAGSDAMFFNYYLAKNLKINHNPLTIKAMRLCHPPDGSTVDSFPLKK